MKLISRLIYRYWYRYVYLRSPAWEATKREYKNCYCKNCGHEYQLQLHHSFYALNYRPQFEHFLPGGYNQMREIDRKSVFVTLCDRCHGDVHAAK